MHNTHFLSLNLCALFLLGCGSAVTPTTQATSQPTNTEPSLILEAENNAPPAAHAILKQTREMAEIGEIIRGGCWNYLNTAWNRAGFTANKRKTIFKGSYPNGPFANSNTIQVGDWLYYVNHSYNDIEHSGMFIAWTNKANHEALIFSYAGEHRQTPARYSVYNIDKVYQITRAIQ